MEFRWTIWQSYTIYQNPKNFCLTYPLDGRQCRLCSVPRAWLQPAAISVSLFSQRIPPAGEAHQSFQPQCQTFCCLPCWSDPGLQFETSPPQYCSYSPGTSSLQHTALQLGRRGTLRSNDLLMQHRCHVYGNYCSRWNRSFETYIFRLKCERLLQTTYKIMLYKKEIIWDSELHWVWFHSLRMHLPPLVLQMLANTLK